MFCCSTAAESNGGVIDTHRDEYDVEPIYAGLPIALLTYYEVKACETDPARLPVRMRWNKPSTTVRQMQDLSTIAIAGSTLHLLQ
jgi:hypothetical protein